MYVADACVLLDLIDADSSVVPLASSHLGQILIPDVVLSMAGALDATKCRRLGVKVRECEVDRLVKAAGPRRGTSFEDRVCLILAREEGWTVLTHERVVRAACEADGIPSACAFDLVCLLQEGGHLTPSRAVGVARNLREVNPRCLTDEQLEAYVRRTSAVLGQSRKGHPSK